MKYDECLDRLEIIQTLEMKFQAKVVTFYRNRRNQEGIIAEEGYDDFQFALNKIGDVSPLVVIIDSIGGETFSGWKIASCLNDRVGQAIIIVPEQALSAATLIAMSGSHVIMHPNALLSPVDPQYFYQGNLVSALDLMNSPDPVIQRKAIRAIEQSKEYVRLLCKGKIGKVEKIEKIVKRLLLEDRVHASHSSPIKAGEIRTLGFRVKTEAYIDVRALHNLYRRHYFCEHDPKIIIEYSRNPIPDNEGPQAIVEKLEKPLKYFEF